MPPARCFSIIQLSNSRVIEEKKESESTDVMNFATLCKKFPNISFVVVDSIDAIKQEYTGVCNTDAFGNLDKISIIPSLTVSKTKNRCNPCIY